MNWSNKRPLTTPQDEHEKKVKLESSTIIGGDDHTHMHGEGSNALVWSGTLLDLVEAAHTCEAHHSFDWSTSILCRERMRGSSHHHPLADTRHHTPMTNSWSTCTGG